VNVRWSALQLAVLAAATTGACIKIEKFSFRDGGALGSDDANDGGSGSGTGAEAKVVGSDNHVEVTLGSLYRMVFSADGYHFPSELHGGNAQGFGTTPETCATEQGVGVGYVPAGLFSSIETSGLTKQPSTIKVDLEGPGIARVSLDWAAAFSKGGSCVGAPSGRSVFTFFPDGRIQRMDAARMSGSPAADFCRCADLSDAVWDIETFYSFKQAFVSQIVGITALPSGDGVNEYISEPTVCINPPAGDFQIGIAWRAHAVRRVRNIGSSASYAFIADMALPGATTAPGLVGDTSTTLVIGTSTDCTAVRARAAPFADDIQIDIALGGAEPIVGGFGLGQDGLYGGEHSQSGGVGGYEPAGSPIKITPRAPSTTVPPFGIWLDLRTRRNVTSVTRMPGNVPAVYTQQELPDAQNLPSGQFVFWIPDGLGAGESIIIEASP
jgi:hypothetical protein